MPFYTSQCRGGGSDHYSRYTKPILAIPYGSVHCSMLIHLVAQLSLLPDSRNLIQGAWICVGGLPRVREGPPGLERRTEELSDSLASSSGGGDGIDGGT